jgi:type II secretory pathway component PulK
MGIMIVLTGLVLVFGRQMRVEALASGNLVASLQADAIVAGAAKHVVNQLVTNLTTNFLEPLQSNIDQEIQAQAVALGDGLFWIVRPNADDERQYSFGVVDEASKLNLNSSIPKIPGLPQVAPTYMLMLLPGRTPDLAASIVDWRSYNQADPGQGGAESSYYEQLPEPYYCKNSPFETLDELRLVKGATPEILYGVDVNHNGVVDEEETGQAPVLAGLNGQSQCGICKFLTVYSAQPNTSLRGRPRTYVGDNTAPTLAALANLLSTNRSHPFAAGRVAAIIARLRGRPPALNVLDFYAKSGMTIDEFKSVADKLTTSRSQTLTGLINVNTAPREVLICLPGLTEGDVEQLIATRSANGPDLDTIAWVAEALSMQKAAAIGGLITTRSYQYSADIVAVAGNGRGFKRCKYVFDLRYSPARILLRQDLTHLGWPLDAKLWEDIRAGKVVPSSGLLPGLSNASTAGGAGTGGRP